MESEQPKMKGNRVMDLILSKCRMANARDNYPSVPARMVCTHETSNVDLIKKEDFKRHRMVVERFFTKDEDPED